jgi:hypothetical protein
LLVVWVNRFLALQLGLVHPSVVWAARTMFETLVVVTLPRIIPWARSVDIMSVEVVIEYREGITGSHFVVGGINHIIIPLQVSSNMTWVLKLSTAALRVRSNLMCSCISASSVYSVRFNTSWACD